jgi:hypothetical protein
MPPLSQNSRWIIHDDTRQSLHDRKGNELLHLEKKDGAWSRVRLKLPSKRWITLEAQDHHQPILGAMDGLTPAEHDHPVAWVQRINWLSPETIPAVDTPGALPGGAGSALLNFLALQAQASGRPCLHYAGPYPSAALFDTLFQSFRLEGDINLACELFTAEAEQQALRGESRDIPVDFIPHPFEWLWVTPDICAQLREGLEAVYIQGSGYFRDRAGPRRLLREGDGWAAVIELGGHLWTQRALFDADGALIGEVAPLPAPAAHNEGVPLPESFRAVLVKGLVPRSPELLRESLALVLQQTPLCWGDTGEDAARAGEEGIVVHSALRQILRNQDPATILTTLSQTIEGPATRLAQAVLSRAHANSSRSPTK